MRLEGLFARTRHGEKLAHPRKVAVAEARDRLEPRHVEPAVHQRVVADVDTRDLADDEEVRPASEGHDPAHPAFERGGGCGDA